MAGPEQHRQMARIQPCAASLHQQAGTTGVKEENNHYYLFCFLFRDGRDLRVEDAFSVQPQRVGYARLDLKRQAAQGGAIIAANTDFHRCVGLDEGTALGKSIAELIPQWNGQHMEDQEASPRWHWGPVGQSEQPHLSIMIPEDGQWHVLCLALPVQEWEEQQMRAQTIFTMAPIGLCHFDARGKVFDLNPTFSEVIGSKREHIIGVDLLQLPERSVVSGVKQALAGKPAYFEGRYTAVTSGKTTPVRAV